MTALDFWRLSGALQTNWQGARLGKAWQDDLSRIWLELDKPGDSAFLVFAESPNPGFGLSRNRPKCRPTPPAMPAYLRAHLDGARLAGAGALAFERLAWVDFAKGGQTYRLLLSAVESKPKILLLDQSGAILMASRWFDGQTKIIPKSQYQYPAIPQGFVTPDQADIGYFEELSRLGQKPKIIGISSASFNGKSPGESLALAMRVAGEFTRPLDPIDGEEALFDAGARLMAGETQKPADSEDAWRKKLERRIKKIEADLASMQNPDEVARLADLLAGSLHLVKRGMDRAQALDFNDGKTVVIPLKKELSPGGNLDYLYGRARKLRRGRLVAGKRLEEAKAELLRGPPVQAQTGKEIAQPEGVKNFRLYKSRDRWKILVGKNRLENDKLLKVAKPWDIWFHVRDAHGAHVLLVKPGRDSKPTEGTLMDAGGLAALYSGLSGEEKASVMYVEAARVKKPKGAGPGRVLVSGEKTLVVKPREP